MHIRRNFHLDHIDSIEFIPEMSCDLAYHTDEEVDKADALLFTQAPKIYAFLTSLK